MELIDYLIAPFVTPGRNLYWGNFLGGLFVAAILAIQAKKHWKPALHYIVPVKILFHRSSLVDYQYYLILKACLFLTYPYLFQFIGSLKGFLLRAIQLPTLEIGAALPDWLGSGLYFALSLLVIDFGLFFAHWLMHKVPFFWEFHKVHHSAQVLNPLTVVRMHPVDFYLNAFVISLLLLIKEVFWNAAVGQAYSPLELMGANLVMLVLYAGDGLLRHSHVWLSYGHTIEKILLSPAQHQVHHSAEARHFDKNLGMRFAVWDRLFGTLYTTHEKESFRLGLYNKEDREFKSAIHCLALPFIKLCRKAGSPLWSCTKL